MILGAFLSPLDATVVNVSLPTLAVELRSSLSTIQWGMSGYLLALALMLPLNGWLVDRIGAKRLYLWYFATFTLSSALCGAAWSAESLVVFRVLQGMSGGLLAPMAQMMLARAAGKHMARVMGYAALPILLGPILGPVLAGTILQHASWRWLFLVNVPVCLAGIVLAALFLPDDSGERRVRAFSRPQVRVPSLPPILRIGAAFVCQNVTSQITSPFLLTTAPVEKLPTSQLPDIDDP